MRPVCHTICTIRGVKPVNRSHPRHRCSTQDANAQNLKLTAANPTRYNYIRDKSIIKIRINKRGSRDGCNPAHPTKDTHQGRDPPSGEVPAWVTIGVHENTYRSNHGPRAYDRCFSVSDLGLVALTKGAAKAVVLVSVHSGGVWEAGDVDRGNPDPLLAWGVFDRVTSVSSQTSLTATHLDDTRAPDAVGDFRDSGAGVVSSAEDPPSTSRVRRNLPRTSVHSSLIWIGRIEKRYVISYMDIFCTVSMFLYTVHGW